MSIRGSWLAVVSVSVAVGATYYLQGVGSEPSMKSDPVDAPDPASARTPESRFDLQDTKIRQLLSAVDRLEAAQRRLESLLDLALANSTPSIPRTENESSSATVDPEESIERYSHALAERFTEPIDRAWSEDATALLYASYYPLVRERRAVDWVSASCKRSLCRVELLARNREEVDGLLRALMQADPWGGVSTFRTEEEPSGSFSIVGYLARSGHALPSRNGHP